VVKENEIVIRIDVFKIRGKKRVGLEVGSGKRRRSRYAVQVALEATLELLHYEEECERLTTGNVKASEWNGEKQMNNKNLESKVRRLAIRHGFYVTKSRQRPHYDNQGLYQLIDSYTSMPLLGVRFDADLTEIEEYIQEKPQWSSLFNVRDAANPDPTFSEKPAYVKPACHWWSGNGKSNSNKWTILRHELWNWMPLWNAIRNCQTRGDVEALADEAVRKDLGWLFPWKTEKDWMQADSRRNEDTRMKSRTRAVANRPAATVPIREIVFKQLIEEECRALGLQHVVVALDLIGHSARLQFRANDEKDAGRLRARAFTAVEEMKPEGINQTMLAVQMVGTHYAIGRLSIKWFWCK
jgi:hypothetical protein